jgi:hypothetical protein
LLRDPRDVARSAIGMGWVGHVYFGVDIWIEAEKSWNQLKNSLTPEQYMEIKYEDILDDVEAGLGEICSFLGLEYSRGMLSYAQNSTYDLPDKTLSYQWKRKYSPRELQLVEWKLGKMLTDRGYEPSGHVPDAPGLLELVGLKIRHRQYRIMYGLKKYGFTLYVENILARRAGWKSWRESVKHRVNAIDIAGLK